MESILNKAESYFEQNLPFVVFKKPNSSIVRAYFQKNDNLYQAKDGIEKGFVFTNFNASNWVLIPESQSYKMEANWQIDLENVTKTDSNYKIDLVSKTKHENLVQKGIDAILNGDFEKLVLSRKETISIDNFKISIYLKKIINQYPECYCYCWFHPKVGLWMGAFSEQLVKIKDQKISTMAVAGTQKIVAGKDIIWLQKERDEQQFVTNFIVSNLSQELSSLVISEPFTLKAGSLAHLKTTIEGNLKPNFDLKKIITILHPTPAVCGLPKQKAKDFILANEGYDRSFYAGFFGELNLENTTDLYVNLRCMQIEPHKKTATIYVGGGITKDSIPEQEWQETVNKSMIIKNIIN